jgi:hypothetical protein
MEGSIIISCGVDFWHPKGIARLEESLENVEWNGSKCLWNDIWPNDHYDTRCPYNVKPAAFEEAIRANYKNILWVDSSVWAVQNPQPLFDVINRDGYFFLNNGANLAQTVNDKCLDYFKINRDEAEGMTECASGILGVNTEHEDGISFIRQWIKAGKDGAYSGSRLHDNQSEDPRFLYHRQDQSAASCIINLMGLKLTEWGGLCSYEPGNCNERTVFTLQGM